MTFHTSTFPRDQIGKMGIELHFRGLKAVIIKIRYTQRYVHILWKQV